MEFDVKKARLLEGVRALESAAVAFSGGVDSALVLKVCADVLGAARDRVLAVTGDSDSFPEREFREARALTEQLGVEHVVVATREMEVEGYLRNAPDRCFFCKTELYEVVGRVAAERGIRHVVDGFNASDVSDHRPGARAGLAAGVVSPLRDADFTKDDIRRYARELGLPLWDKPALACLSSRVPYGTRIEAGMLHQIARAEELLRSLGFRQVRVRHHGEVARIELEPADIAAAASEHRTAIEQGLRAIGYRYVTLDLRGYRTGSLNEALR